MEVIRRLAA